MDVLKEMWFYIKESFVHLLFGYRWAQYTALTIGVLGAVSERIYEYIDFPWIKLAKVLSFIGPNILLSIVFYFFLFPISQLTKIFGAKNMLQLKNNIDCTWVESNREIDRPFFEKMW